MSRRMRWVYCKLWRRLWREANNTINAGVLYGIVKSIPSKSCSVFHADYNMKDIVIRLEPDGYSISAGEIVCCFGKDNQALVKKLLRRWRLFLSVGE